MVFYLSNFEKTLKSLLSVSFLLIIFDSYEIFEIPLSWLGSFLLTFIVFMLFRKEEIKFNQLIFVCILVGLLPTLFTFNNFLNSEDEIIYILLRIFSFISFAFTSFVISKSKYKEAVLASLKSIFYIMIFVSLYLYIAQIFNLYEPFRNRPGTGILGFDQQNNFWISGSHRMVGTFREPVFLVSILFPIFLVIHFRNMNSIKLYIGAALLFGLTKSELAFVLVIFLIFIDLLRKNIGLNNLVFYLIFFICFFIPIKECDISPSNIECPEIVEEESTTIEKNIDILDNNSPVESLSNEQFEYIDRERSDIISFTSKFIDQNVGFGFQRTNKIYTEYLAEDVFYQMYLTNRTLPDYLNTRYLARSFGTGRYFLTYENINIQNNFLFNLFSMGMFYAVLIVCICIYFLFNHFQHGLKIVLILSIISLASVEDLLPIFGLYLSLMFTMDRHEN